MSYIRNTIVSDSIVGFINEANKTTRCCRCDATVNPKLDDWSAVAQPYRAIGPQVAPVIAGGMLCGDCHGSWHRWMQELGGDICPQ